MYRPIFLYFLSFAHSEVGTYWCGDCVSKAIAWVSREKRALLTYLDGDLIDACEPSLLQTLSLQAFGNTSERCLRPERARTILNQSAPFEKGRIFSEGSVVGLRKPVAVEGLNPASRLESPVSLTEELSPVSDGAYHPAKVDEVEGIVLAGPVLSVVIDLADHLSIRE